MRRPQHTGIVANDLKFGGDENDRAALVQELASDLTGPIVLGENLSQPGNLIASVLDQLIVMDDLPPNARYRRGVDAAATFARCGKGFSQ